MLALLALLPALALAAPLQKRYTGAYILSGRDNLCLTVQGGVNPVLANGSPVFSVPCIDASTWDINPGSGSIFVSGSNQAYALDAGSNPGNNGALKIWQSYPGLYQQTWYLTGDNRIAITGGNQCLDEGTNGIQTYQCTTGNTNQVFYIQQGSSPNGPTTSPTSTPTTTTTVTPTSTSTPYSIPTGPVYTDPSTGGQRLHPNGRPDLCVTVTNGFAGIGSAVQITGCFANNDDFITEQLWDLPAPGTTGAIQVHNKPGLCLDAGDSPSDGSGIKIYTCYSGLLQQTWSRSGQTGTLALGNGQCLDVVAGSAGSYPQKPYAYNELLQTWQCSNNGDPQQVFFTL